MIAEIVEIADTAPDPQKLPQFKSIGPMAETGCAVPEGWADSSNFRYWEKMMVKTPSPHSPLLIRTAELNRFAGKVLPYLRGNPALTEFHLVGYSNDCYLAEYFHKIKGVFSAAILLSQWTAEPFALPESSTREIRAIPGLAEQVDLVFRRARYEFFEDGVASDFSHELISLTKKFGNAAIEVITLLIVSGRVHAEVGSEALRWLGRVDHPASYDRRRWLLERSLFSSSAKVRDGAILGLAAMDDPSSIAFVRLAIENEHLPELRLDLQQLLSQLEEKH